MKEVEVLKWVKNGVVIKDRLGAIHLVVREFKVLGESIKDKVVDLNSKDFRDLSDWNKDLTHKKDRNLDMVEVYKGLSGLSYFDLKRLTDAISCNNPRELIKNKNDIVYTSNSSHHRVKVGGSYYIYTDYDEAFAEARRRGVDVESCVRFDSNGDPIFSGDRVKVSFQMWVGGSDWYPDDGRMEYRDIECVCKGDITESGFYKGSESINIEELNSCTVELI